MKNKLEQIIEKHFEGSGLKFYEVEDKQNLNRFLLKLHFEKCGKREIITPLGFEAPSIVWANDELILIEHIKYKFIEDYTFCNKCDDSGWTEEIGVCDRAVSDCCGGCSKPVKCECNNN